MKTSLQTILYALVTISSSIYTTPIVKKQKNITPGIRYTKLQINNPCSNIVHLTYIDPIKTAIKLIPADNQCIGLKTVSDIAQEHNALAAINASFNLDNGSPAGICKINEHWLSDQKLPRGALAWTQDGKNTLISIVDVKTTITIAQTTVQVSRINQPRKNDNIILYTPSYNTSTLTDNTGTEIIIADNKITTISCQKGNSPIPHNGFVLSFGSKTTPPDVTIGMEISIQHTWHSPDKEIEPFLQTMDFIVGGTPVLIKDKKAATTIAQEKTIPNFITDRCARTAVGIMPNGEWLFVTVEKSSSTHSLGMSIPELIQLMLSLNCTDALNLCGRYATTLVIDNNVIYPNQYFLGFSSEKLVGDALVVTNRDSTAP